MYKTIVDNFLNNPRDVHTVPMTKREPLWFYVYVEDGKLWVDIAKEHKNSSSIKIPRFLKESECEAMLDIYHRRSKGESVSAEAMKTTINQVYWYGVFNELEL